MRIKRGGAYRNVSESDYKKHFKSLGYMVVEEPLNEPPDKPLDISIYDVGNGWYEYEGKKYRKGALLDILGESDV